MERTTIAATMAALVGIILIGAVLVPTIDLQTKETVNVSNTGAGELEFTYYAEPTDYTQSGSYDSVESELTIGLQTVTAADMIVWASDIGAIVYSDGHFYLTADDSGTPSFVDLGTSYTVTSASSAITVEDSDETVYTGTATWSYVPYVDGNFGYFDETGKNIAKFPLAAAGYFVGIGAYNQVTDPAGLVMDADVTSGHVVQGVEWNFTE